MADLQQVLQDVVNTLSSIGISRDLLTRLLIAVVILVVGYFMARLITRIVGRVLYKIYPRQITILVSRIIYYVLLFIVIVMFLGSLGVDVSGLVIAGGFAGLIVGVALQPILSNVFAGLYILAEKAVRPGDAVEVSGVSGEVVALSIMFTKIRTWDGVFVTVPNNALLSTVLKNYSRVPIRRVDFTVSIAYKEDAGKAYQVIKGVLDKYPYTLVQPAPDIFVSSLGDSGVNIAVRAWVPRQYYLQALKDLPQLVKKAIQDAGIEIPFPQVDVWFRTPLQVRENPSP